MHTVSIANSWGKPVCAAAAGGSRRPRRGEKAEEDLYILCLLGLNVEKAASSSSVFLDCNRATCLEMCGCVRCVSRGGGWGYGVWGNGVFVARKG